MKYIDEIKKLGLPKDKFAVFGSGPMAIRGLRANKDVDIIVKMELWNKLVGKYPFKEGRDDCVSVGHIDIFRDWQRGTVGGADRYIDEADVIQGIRFITLEHTIEWKKERHNDKDKEDISLIERFLESGRKSVKK